MKIIVTKYLQVRQKAPRMSKDSHVYLSPGSVIEVEPKLMKGDLYQGNDQWYKGLDGNYYWSGAVKKITKIPQQTIAAGLGNYSNAEIAKMAIQQNKQTLLKKFPNINTVSDAVNDLDAQQSHIIAIYLKDSNVKGIPEKLNVKLPDGHKMVLSTEIIKSSGIAKIHYAQLTTEVANSNKPAYTGSICCAVKYADRNDFTGLLTSAHIYTLGAYNDKYNGLLNASQQEQVLVDKSNKAIWYLKVMSSKQDLGIVKLTSAEKKDANYKSFNNSYYQISDIDVKTATPNVSILSKNNNSRDAYILDYNVGIDINYDNGPSYKKNIILIGTTNDRDTSQTVSAGGDSGSCVYHKETGKLIGMLLGGNDKFSFVLPIQETLNAFNLITI